jgi:integrase
MASVKLTRDAIRGLRPGAKTYEVRDADCAGFVVRIQPTGRAVYAVRYARGKQMTIGRADALAPDEARKKALTVIADFARGIDPMVQRREARLKQEIPTLGAYLDGEYGEWAASHYADGGATVKRMKAVFADLLDTSLDQVTAWQIEKWRMQRTKAGAKGSTINRQLNPLKALFGRAVEFEVIPTNPLAGVVRLQKTDSTPKVRYLSSDEESRLMAALDAREARIRQERASANAWRAERGYALYPDLCVGYADHLKPMVILSLNTGMRRGELFGLKWSEVDVAAPMLTVLGAGAKSGETRHIPLNVDAIDALKMWMAQSATTTGYVFPGEDGGRLSVGVRSSWASVLEAAGIGAFRWHDLRHTFASNLVMAGVDLYPVQRLLGHKSPKMTQRYAHLSPDVLAQAVARLSKPTGARPRVRRRASA